MTKLYARIIGPTIIETKFQKAIHLRNLYRGQEISSHLYSILPWSMKELPGSTWRNIYTADTVTVRFLGENKRNQVGPDPDEFGFSIGLWRSVGFCIEHWIRVDILLAEEQIAWAEERVAICRRELREAESSITYSRYRIESATETLGQARQELTSLCGKFGIELGVDILNVGILPGEQMKMF